MYKVKISLSSEMSGTKITETTISKEDAFKQLVGSVKSTYATQAKNVIAEKGTATFKFIQNDIVTEIQMTPESVKVIENNNHLVKTETVNVANGGWSVLAEVIARAKEFKRRSAIRSVYKITAVKSDGTTYVTSINKESYLKYKENKTLHNYFPDVITIIVGEENGDGYTRVEVLNFK